MRIYTPEPLPHHNIYQAFLFRYAPELESKGLFKEHLPINFFKDEVSYMEDPHEADVIVLPNNFTYLDEKTGEYIKKYADMAETMKKPLHIFSCGDLTDTLEFDPRARVFRYSIYKSQMCPQDISIPTISEDLGREGIVFREKSILPIVSFCGKAGFSSSREWFATFLRRIKYEIQGIFSPNSRARIRGVYWRIWALKVCEYSLLIKTLFIVRKTFSGAVRTIELSPEQARKEFVRSIAESDFVLAPKGDGNYSNRFLEAFSMGRIPILIDTDVVLPFEDRIDYTKIIVRIPMNSVSQTPQHIREFYDALTPQEWKERQKLARTTFEVYLRQDSFFRQFFQKI
jgi:hypothetical protein